MPSRRKILSGSLIAAAALLGGASLTGRSAAEARQATLYKTPECDCCEGYAAYLRRNGYDVKVIATHDLSRIKRDHGVPSALDGCHTTIVGDYVVEGHVPVAPVNRLLAEKPDIKGISLPGMPQGSPGMSGTKAAPFTIYAFRDGAPLQVYAIE